MRKLKLRESNLLQVIHIVKFRKETQFGNQAYVTPEFGRFGYSLLSICPWPTQKFCQYGSPESHVCHNSEGNWITPSSVGSFFLNK